MKKTSITVVPASEERMRALLEEDFTWETTGRFDLVADKRGFSLHEVLFPQPKLLGKNTFYHKEIEKYISYLSDEDTLALVALYEDKPVGYLYASVEEWTGGIVVNAEAILVSREYRNKGIAKALL